MFKRILVFAALLLLPTRTFAQTSIVQGTGTLLDETTDLPGFSTSLLSYTIIVPTSPTDAYEMGFGYEIDHAFARFIQNGTMVEFTGFFTWFTLEEGGGFEFWGNDFLLGLFADQIFVGPVETPTFVDGTFPVEASIGLIESLEFTITSVVPEPSTLLLFAFGFVVLASAQKSRKRTEFGPR